MKKIAFLAVCILLMPFLSAKGINFQIVQITPAQTEIFEISKIFEEAVTDFFYEAGHIVTNSASCIKNDGDDNEEFKKVLLETITGGMEMLVRVEISFKEGEGLNPKGLNLNSIDNISWNIYAASTGKLVSSSQISFGNDKNIKMTEAEIYNFASFVASKISSGLRN